MLNFSLIEYKGPRYRVFAVFYLRISIHAIEKYNQPVLTLYVFTNEHLRVMR